MDIELSINPELTRTILTRFIHKEVTRAGFERVVVGLSGGLDSAVSCFLAAEALGPQNVLAVRMPYRSSSPESLSDAAKVIAATGVQSLDVEITAMVEPLFERFPDATPTRRGNVMARERMIVLYDQSEAFRGLVLGTGNKTEILLGYTTIYGDAASALNPLGDLYKTQVRQLAAELGVTESVRTKPPSADLWLGQTDEGELGYTYAEVDRLLYLVVDERYSPAECVQAGFEEKFVRAVIERMRRNQFKRMLPIVAKISPRTVGYDFLYPRDWGT